MSAFAKKIKMRLYAYFRARSQSMNPLGPFEKAVLFLLALALRPFCVDGKRRMLYLKYMQAHGIGVVPQRYFEPLPLVADIDMATRAPRLIAKEPGPTDDFKEIIARRNDPAELQKFDTWMAEISNNPMFRGLDAMAYAHMIAKYKPKRIIEIGSGFSALLALNALQSNGIEGAVTSIEPFPRDFLRSLHETHGNYKLIAQKIQEVPLADDDMFAALQANDILFIDSTHVSTIGGDLTTIFCEIFPKIRSGVVVHVHDVSWPYEYPRRQAYDYGRFYNELYLISAIIGQGGYRYLFGSYHSELTAPIPHGLASYTDYARGMSLWLQKK